MLDLGEFLKTVLNGKIMFYNALHGKSGIPWIKSWRGYIIWLEWKLLAREFLE